MSSRRPPPRAHKWPIVVADDSPLILEMVCDLFQHAGVKVHTIASAIGLSGLLHKVRPGAIILDRNMPGILGVEAIDTARKVCPWAAIYLFSDDPRADAEAEKLGIVSISKSEPDKLRRRVLHALGLIPRP